MNVYIVGLVLLLIIVLVVYYQTQKVTEGFVSGKEQMMVRYDRIYPLDHPRYVTPQQKDFQMILSEHSALNNDLQNRREDIRTQLCKVGEKCFDTAEYHALNYQMRSAPDIINSKIDPTPPVPPNVVYMQHQDDFVVPSNTTAKEARADLFDDIMLPDLFFKQRNMTY